MKLKKVLIGLAALGVVVAPLAAQAATYAWGFNFTLTSVVTTDGKTYDIYTFEPAKSNGT